MTPETAAKLREPFKPAQVGKLPRVTCKPCRESRGRACDQHRRIKCHDCGNWITSAHIHLDYVGHAEITDRLLQADPEWTWEPVAFDEQGLPRIDRAGGLWIRLTVAGVTRLGYGHADGKTGPDAVKEAIGDALRNAGMRFGVALDLWGATFEPDSASSEPGLEENPPAQPAEPDTTPPDPNAVRDWALEKERSADGLDHACKRLQAEHPQVAAATVVNETGSEEQLQALLMRRARDLTPTPASEPRDDGRRRRRMHVLFGELGFGGDNNRSNRLAVCSKVLGRVIATSDDLTPDDVEQIIAALVERQQTTNEPVGAST